MADLPKAPVEYLEISFVTEGTAINFDPSIVQNNALLPFAVSPLLWAPVISAEKITSGEDVKDVYDLVLGMQDAKCELVPGDTVGIFPKNDSEEYEALLKRLNLHEKIDTPCKVGIKSTTTKKNASVPSYIPPSCTLRYIFESCLDLYAVPKKLFIRALLEYTSDPKEREGLRNLCSRTSQLYSEWVSSGRSFLFALLSDYPSCCPPASVILEHLPRLQPRPYSISYITGGNNSQVHILFSVTEFYCGGLKKKGLCTGWLQKITQTLRTTSEDNISTICSQVEGLSIKDDTHPLVVPVFLRKSNGFNAPSDPTVAMIMIGAGVGVSPFIGFLQQREKQLEEQRMKGGSCVLFTGCRYEDRDMLLRNEIKRQISVSTLDRCLSAYSREKTDSKYVQDKIREEGLYFCKLLLDENALLYVCGDAQNMAKDVASSIVDTVQNCRNMSKAEAERIITDLQVKGQYKEDVWT